MQSHEHEEYSEFFYKPHTLISLTILLALLFFMVQTNFLENFAATISLSNEENKAKSTLSGEFKRNGALIGVCIAFVAFGSIHLPNTLMTRPHPFFWRALLSVFTLYAMFITYLFLLPLDEARNTLKIFDQDLGKPLPERSYADDCRVFTPEHPTSSMANISDAVFDVHFIAHFLGWWGKMVIMRDWFVAWTCSIGFELVELTFKHWLPNFEECWWDQLFLDLFGCNFIGILLGVWSLNHFGSARINWVFDREYAR